MEAGSINLEKVSVDIDNILSDIKSYYNDSMLNNINIPQEKGFSPIEFENACKIFGCGTDK